jgi:hypothetical protein
MKRTLRLAILTFTVSLAVFAPVAGASHDSPNPGADIVGHEAIYNESTQKLDLDVFFEGNTVRGLRYTVTVYDEADLLTELDTASISGDGTTTLSFVGLDVEAFTCDDPFTEGNEASGDSDVFLVVSVTAGSHVFDRGEAGEDFCFPPSGQGMD